MMTTVIRSIMLLILIPLVGCGAPEEEPVVETKPRAVRVETITSRDLPIVVNAVGRLLPNREVTLSAEVCGIVMQYNADVGSAVDEAAILVHIDHADYELALKEAKANLRTAEIRLPVTQKSYERAQELLPDNVITQERYDQAEAAYESAKALVDQLKTTVALARRRLEKTTIRAPYDGYVTQRFVEMGQRVAMGDPVMQIADMQTMRVKIHINELDYVHVDKKDRVNVTVEAFSKTPMAGRVDEIGIQADPRTNTFEVEILVDNSLFHLKAGLTARVVIETESIPDAVLISQDSILFREDRKEVFVVDENDRAAAREVKLGRMDGSYVHVLEGLRPGDKLVTAGGPYLKTGDAVVVTP